VVLAHGRVQEPSGEVALDVIPVDEIAHERERLDRDLPHRACIGATDQPLELRLPGGNAEKRLATAASGGAPGNPMLLEQHDGESRLCEVQGARAPRNARPHHAHIALDRALERRARRRRERGGRVVGANVARALHRFGLQIPSV